MTKQILLTGGSGFIGSAIRSQLSKRYSILAPSHHQLDLCDGKALKSFFKRRRIDAVIHAAIVGGSQKSESVDRQMQINTLMFSNIMRCRKYFGTYIHLGSGAEYDKSRALRSVQEDAFGESVPWDDYGLYKFIAAQYLEVLQGKRNVNLRIFGLYGPGEEYRLRFISNMLVSAVVGKSLVIHRNCMFDYVYIDDLVRIIDQCIIHPMTHVSYNVGSGTRRSLLSIAKRIQTQFAPHLPVVVTEPGMNKEYTCDNTRLLRDLGGFVFSDFDKTLASLYDWYHSRKNTLIL